MGCAKILLATILFIFMLNLIQTVDSTGKRERGESSGTRQSKKTRGVPPVEVVKKEEPIVKEEGEDAGRRPLNAITGALLPIADAGQWRPQEQLACPRRMEVGGSSSSSAAFPKALVEAPSADLNPTLVKASDDPSILKRVYDRTKDQMTKTWGRIKSLSDSNVKANEKMEIILDMAQPVAGLVAGEFGTAMVGMLRDKENPQNVAINEETEAVMKSVKMLNSEIKEEFQLLNSRMGEAVSKLEKTQSFSNYFTNVYCVIGQLQPFYDSALKDNTPSAVEAFKDECGATNKENLALKALSHTKMLIIESCAPFLDVCLLGNVYNDGHRREDLLKFSNKIHRHTLQLNQAWPELFEKKAIEEVINSVVGNSKEDIEESQLKIVAKQIQTSAEQYGWDIYKYQVLIQQRPSTKIDLNHTDDDKFTKGRWEVACPEMEKDLRTGEGSKSMCILKMDYRGVNILLARMATDDHGQFPNYNYASATGFARDIKKIIAKDDLLDRVIQMMPQPDSTGAVLISSAYRREGKQWPIEFDTEFGGAADYGHERHEEKELRNQGKERKIFLLFPKILYLARRIVASEVPKHGQVEEFNIDASPKEPFQKFTIIFCNSNGIVLKYEHNFKKREMTMNSYWNDKWQGVQKSTYDQTELNTEQFPFPLTFEINDKYIKVKTHGMVLNQFEKKPDEPIGKLIISGHLNLFSVEHINTSGEKHDLLNEPKKGTFTAGEAPHNPANEPQKGASSSKKAAAPSNAGNKGKGKQRQLRIRG